MKMRSPAASLPPLLDVELLGQGERQMLIALAQGQELGVVAIFGGGELGDGVGVGDVGVVAAGCPS